MEVALKLIHTNIMHFETLEDPIGCHFIFKYLKSHKMIFEKSWQSSLVVIFNHSWFSFWQNSKMCRDILWGRCSQLCWFSWCCCSERGCVAIPWRSYHSRAQSRRCWMLHSDTFARSPSPAESPRVQNVSSRTRETGPVSQSWGLSSSICSLIW